MDCREAREGLWPPERPRLVGDDVAAAQLHVRQCPECTRFFAQDRALLDAYARLRRIRAPMEVRERVFSALAQARASTSSPARSARRAWLPWPPSVALAAAVAVAGTAIGLFVMRGGTEPAAHVQASESAYIEDYLRRAVGRDYLDTTDSEEIARFLERELGLPLRPLRAEGLEPRRVEICLLDGQRGAMIEYVMDDRVVSHYIVPRAGLPGRPPALGRRSEPMALPLVTWAASSVEQALVGDMSGERLMALARGGV